MASIAQRIDILLRHGHSNVEVAALLNVSLEDVAAVRAEPATFVADPGSDAPVYSSVFHGTVVHGDPVVMPDLGIPAAAVVTDIAVTLDVLAVDMTGHDALSVGSFGSPTLKLVSPYGDRAIFSSWGAVVYSLPARGGFDGDAGDGLRGPMRFVTEDLDYGPVLWLVTDGVDPVPGLEVEVRLTVRALAASLLPASAADAVAPFVRDTLPLEAAMDVAVDSDQARLMMSEPIDLFTLLPGSYTIDPPVANTVLMQLSSDAPDVLLVWRPTNWEAATEYTITLLGGIANSVKDLAGNALAEDFVLTFTTAA